jgi:uncharacterized protein (UPF0276 family)
MLGGACEEVSMNGVGLGLRWSFLEELLEHPDPGIALVEISPENYMRRGGYFPEALARVGERFEVLTHGLSMSLGGTDALDDRYFDELRRFLRRSRAQAHSEHLCWSGVPGTMLHELLPLPFTREAVGHVVQRVREAQSRLDVPLALENITYYAPLGRPEMSEATFLNEVLEQSGASLMLDVNNVYVNARNHGFDPFDFLAQLPLERVVQLHVAGHHRWEEDDLLIDTHGAPTPDPVIELLSWVIERTGPLPVILERDQEIPPLDELLSEIQTLRGAYDRALASRQRSRLPAGLPGPRGPRRRAPPRAARHPPRDLPAPGPGRPRHVHAFHTAPDRGAAGGQVLARGAEVLRGAGAGDPLPAGCAIRVPGVVPRPLALA